MTAEFHDILTIAQRQPFLHEDMEVLHEVTRTVL